MSGWVHSLGGLFLVTIADEASCCFVVICKSE